MCDDEPLPPSTVEHIGTYRALIDSILLQIEAESDDAEANDAPPALLDIPAEFKRLPPPSMEAKNVK